MRHTRRVTKQGWDASDRLAIRRANNQFVTRRDGITTRHCFSFGDHYDPERVSIGPLVALNDELLEPGAGYSTHEHRDLDIVTWVLDGVLRHEDSLGVRCLLRPGTAQRLTTGAGVSHSETNDGGPAESLRFVQLWFALPEQVTPSYESRTIACADSERGRTTIAASRASRSRTTLRVPGVQVDVCHLSAEATGALPGASRATAETFTYLAAGVFRTQHDGVLTAGDSVRIAGTGLRGVAVEDVVMVSVQLTAAAPGR